MYASQTSSSDAPRPPLPRRTPARAPSDWRPWLALALCALGCGGSPTPSEVDTEAAGSPRRAPASTGTVTLITGDVVTLQASGLAQVRPGPGRTPIAFRVVQDRGQTSVIPADVADLVATGQLDPLLFNVTELLAEGVGDAERDDVPLLVTGRPAAAIAGPRLASSAAAIARSIPALDAAAVRVRKASGPALLADLRAAARAAVTATASQTGAAPTRLWLDRRYHVVLDRSVPQIGGPAAWARGATGAGEVVAVLDTGVDGSHPDLAGKVVDARSFVDDGLGTADVLGHGTHVASIIAGTGAASGGQFRGVAPDATILSGRVCGTNGCPESAILAGMAWAVVEQHAAIVNLSLGGPDQPGTDPLEDAIDQLSARYGALFVVAAGNDADLVEPSTATESSLDSPGSAAAALTVGAVDHDDGLARFSGRGPHLVDHAIKPDITAPGVDIVAALATTVAPIGDPVGTAYTRLSGTSMAAPHIAGGAALLHQLHPAWTGAQLKAAVMGAAAPSPEQTVFEQGAGRIDLDRATRQAVIAEPSSLSLDTVSWPHDDDPVQRRAVRYRNFGGEPVTLTLRAELGLAGSTAPAGMVAVSPDEITIPPGGSTEVAITVDTTGDGPEGELSGQLVAANDAVRITTPIAIDRQTPGFDLQIQTLAPDGGPIGALVDIYPINPPGPRLTQHSRGTTALHLPAGVYTVTSWQRTVFAIYPRLDLRRDTALVMNGRDARDVQVDVAGAPLMVQDLEYGYRDRVHQLLLGVISVGGNMRALQVGADAPASEVESWVVAGAKPPGSGQDPAEVYLLGQRGGSRFPTGWTIRLDPRQLATVEANHAGEDQVKYQKHAHALFDDDPDFGSVGFVGAGVYDGPFHRTEHYFGAGFLWNPQLLQLAPIPGDPHSYDIASQLDIVRAYHRGPHHESWNQAPFGPAIADQLTHASATRLGDNLTLRPSLTSDPSWPARRSNTPLLWDHRRETLLRDGEIVVDRVDVPDGRVYRPIAVPPGPATYRYALELERPSDLFALSSRVTAAWTFRSEHVASDAPQSLPLLTARWTPPLDDHHRAHGAIMALPLVIDRTPAAIAPITRVTVEASFDDGASWTRVAGVAIGDAWLGLVTHPPGAAFVSLRASVEDAAGERADQTVIRAYAVAP